MNGRPTLARETLPRETLAQPTRDAARALIGVHLVRESDRGTRVGRIVEVEAYIGEDDRASHARFGRTARNTVMYGPPGRAYVYLVYGMYECLNVVTEPEGRPAAVLIRAVLPVTGEAAMRDARGAFETRRLARRGPAAREAAIARIQGLPGARLAAGPGLVAAAFDITRGDTGSDLLDARSSLRLEPGIPAASGAHVATTPRVGIAYAGEPWRSLPWRFVEVSSQMPPPRPAR